MFVYHGCPDERLGSTLYPLRSLEAVDVQLHARELAKYGDHEERQRIPEQRVSKLGCTRREVLNFAPVHPHLIFRAWRELGVTLPAKRWFRVPVVRLAGLPAVVFTPRSGAVGADISDADVRWLDLQHYRELTALPAETLAWYRELNGRDRRGAWFAHVPHVLVKSSVEVAGVDVIAWSAPL